MSPETPPSGAGPSSRFFETRLSTHWPRWEPAPWWFGWLERLLDRFTENKDCEPHLPTLDKWWIEFPIDYDEVWREIGFDENGQPVIAGPSKRNWGLWNDTNMTLSDFERQDPTLVEVTSDEFEETWQRFFASSSDIPRS